MCSNQPSFIFLFAALLGLQTSAQAQTAPGQNDKNVRPLSAYVQAGYQPMGRIFTLLLHTARTGQAYDRALLLKHGQDSLLPEQQALVRQLQQARDEFAAHEPQLKLDEFLNASVARLREDGAFLIPMTGQVQPYDFKLAGFPLSLGFAYTVPWSETPLFCSGYFAAHDAPQSPKKGYATVCLTAANLGREVGFRFVAVPDQELAQQIRARSSSNALLYYAVAHADGRYQTYNPHRFLGSQVFEDYWVAGVQPVKVVELLLVDKQTQAILARAAPAAATASTTDAGAGGEAVATALAAVPAPPPRLGSEVLPEAAAPKTAGAAPGRPAEKAPSSGLAAQLADNAAKVGRSLPQAAPPVPKQKPLEFPQQERPSVNIRLD